MMGEAQGIHFAQKFGAQVRERGVRRGARSEAKCGSEICAIFEKSVRILKGYRILWLTTAAGSPKNF
jgi:hypothetical protein